MRRKLQCTANDSSDTAAPTLDVGGATGDGVDPELLAQLDGVDLENVDLSEIDPELLDQLDGLDPEVLDGLEEDKEGLEALLEAYQDAKEALEELRGITSTPFSEWTDTQKWAVGIGGAVALCLIMCLLRCFCCCCK